MKIDWSTSIFMFWSQAKFFDAEKNHFREFRPKKITVMDRDFSKIWFLTKVFSCFRNQLEIWHRKSGLILQTFVQRGYRKGQVKLKVKIWSDRGCQSRRIIVTENSVIGRHNFWLKIVNSQTVRKRSDLWCSTVIL